jgi:conjugative relaxase-like TrwC/TraI family protein
MRMMGVDSVEYHRATVLGRTDDHPVQALAYYASRGETPLEWGGSGARALGLVGGVTDAQYEAIFGCGGACDPTMGDRLVSTKRPGMELVISAHKSVAELGVIGRAEHMHRIMDAERAATLAYLDDLTRRIGGRRGEAAVRAPTGGLVYAVTRHATSRSGDPCPHDHVLLANVVRMDDAKGGWKGADTALWREHVHAATMVGRLAAARVAIDLGYGIAPDNGPSGRLGHWAIAGVPEEVLQLHSKRAAQIEAEMQRTGNTSYQARNIAARATREPKQEGRVGELVPRWEAEIEAAGWSAERINAAVEREAAARQPPAPWLSSGELRDVALDVVAPDGPLAERKVFARRDVIVAVVPQLYGRDPSELSRVLDRTLSDPEAVPLLGVAGATERAYATATTVAREERIAASVGVQAARVDAPAVTVEEADAAVARAQATLGHRLTSGQREAVLSVCTSGRGAELLVGVAGSGKTTALAAARDAFESAGHEVVGTSTSGQAARTLGREAGIETSRTLASLNWRLDNGRLRLTDRHVLIIDETAMTTDRDLLAVLERARAAHSKVVMVGDHRQLSAVGPGGGFEALLARYGAAVHVMRENVRQRDPAERRALAELRAGKVPKAVAWYASHGRINVSPDRDQALDAAVVGWSADVASGTRAAMLAYQRVNVAELNRRGRLAWSALGRLSGPELLVGSVAYQAGDRVVTLVPGADGQIVTSETGTVLAVDTRRHELSAVMDDDRRVQRFRREDLGPDRLAHSYAVTVHRFQGATVARAHAFEDGGGRELAYVKMSRARECSIVYAVADSLEQAADDLNGAWAHSRRIRWAIDRGVPSPGAKPPRPPHQIDASLRHARLVAERNEIAAAIPPDPGFAVHEAQARVRRLEDERRALDQADGWGVLRGTPVGEAAIAWQQAVTERRACLAQCDLAGLRERHRLRQRAARAGEREGPLRERFAGLAGPELERVDRELPQARAVSDKLDRQAREHQLFEFRHPEAFTRLAHLDREITEVAYQLDLGRVPFDGIVPEPPKALAKDRALDRSPDHGIDFGIGL